MKKKKPGYITVPLNVDQDQIEKLREFKERTGVPIASQLREALKHYIEDVIPERLKIFTK